MAQFLSSVLYVYKVWYLCGSGLLVCVCGTISIMFSRLSSRQDLINRSVSFECNMWGVFLGGNPNVLITE